ncbi:MAG: KilA-N domain-containing protein [Anaerorhabdus sp.]|uniref:KilA-N domain-containing protein n=1 Tax=Anaerorhabdus sp. TaxID=1872524 RepID=UPI003A8BB6E5
MTTQIAIFDIAIHQDSEGRYSLNDLHRAAGAEERHKPILWLRLDQAKEIIDLLKVQICTFNPVHTQRGCKGGTYVCKELVYAYAMWVSAKFHLEVIRAYDALVAAPAPVIPAMPVFPVGKEFTYVTDVGADGIPVAMRVLRPDEFVASAEGHTHMLRRIGYVVISWERMSQLTALGTAQLWMDAKKQYLTNGPF